MDGTFKSKRKALWGWGILSINHFDLFGGSYRGRSSDAFESNKLGTTYTPNRERPTDELPSYCLHCGEKFFKTNLSLSNSRVRESVTASTALDARHIETVEAEESLLHSCSSCSFVRLTSVSISFSPPLGSVCNNFCCVYYSRANGNLKRKRKAFKRNKKRWTLFLLKVEERIECGWGVRSDKNNPTGNFSFSSSWSIITPPSRSRAPDVLWKKWHMLPFGWTPAVTIHYAHTLSVCVYYIAIHQRASRTRPSVHRPLALALLRERTNGTLGKK